MKEVLLLFPPNWSACVNGPHLALPLIAGSVAKYGIPVETWDLSELFYRMWGKRPPKDAIIEACRTKDIMQLDALYFSWEDSLEELASRSLQTFGLLSGFTRGKFDSNRIHELISKGLGVTVFSEYYESVVRPRLQNKKPMLIGITISSQHQLVPAVELILRIKEWLPTTKLILGGNVITRLRSSPSFPAIASLVDRAVVFQGEIAIAEFLKELLGNGETSYSPQGNEVIPYEDWPVPCFDGLDLDQYPGLTAIPYVGTRGCYWGRCPFCAIPAGWATGGYAGSAQAHHVVDQIAAMITSTGVRRIKFVDEAFPPSKVVPLFEQTTQKKVHFLWEAYVRLERAWEEEEVLLAAWASGCRRLYFGLEISPDANRSSLGKNDKGNVIKIMEMCNKVGIQVHLFCMVGHPRTSREDAYRTTQFLIQHQSLIETADLVGFRLDRGTTVPGVRPKPGYASDNELATSYPFEPAEDKVLSFEEVQHLESECQEMIWESAPRLLHPLYRLGNPWGKDDPADKAIQACNQIPASPVESGQW